MPPYLGVVLEKPLIHGEERTAVWQELHALFVEKGLRIRVATGGICTGAEGISRSYSKARKLLESAFFGRRNEVLCEEADLHSGTALEVHELPSEHFDYEICY